MNNEFKKIDLVTSFHRKSIVAISSAYLRERTKTGEIVFEVELWSHSFGDILESFPNYKALNPESVIYKFCWSVDYGDERWGEEENGEVELERLQEFYEHLKTIKSTGQLYSEEDYNAVIEICESTLKNNNQLFLIADYF